MKKEMIMGTRGSNLAVTQTGFITDRLTRLGIALKTEIIKTRGDIVTDRPLRELEGRGYFTKEIEEALLDRRIDIAVHSFKDMPSQIPDSLVLAAISRREDAADLLIINGRSFDSGAGEIPVKIGAIVGTSAVRRESQLRALRSDLKVADLRGNVPTRLAKLANHKYDAIFLAAAGVRRLNLDLSAFEVVRLEPSRFVPSPGQGALAIQMRKADPRLESIRREIHDEETGLATEIEREVMAKFGGGCGLPLGVYASFDGQTWHAYGFWGGDSDSPRWAEVSGGDHRRLAVKLYRSLVGTGN